VGIVAVGRYGPIKTSADLIDRIAIFDAVLILAIPAIYQHDAADPDRRQLCRVLANRIIIPAAIAQPLKVAVVLGAARLFFKTEGSGAGPGIRCCKRACDTGASGLDAAELEMAVADQTRVPLPS
jgi:hypothetical protein